MKREPQFKTEADLCTAFNAWARKEGWTPYPETGGWDVLLVAADGTQIGVQAKLKFNIKVLAQCLPEHYQGISGPDFRAVLVPELISEHRQIAGALGLQCIYPTHSGRVQDFAPALNTGRHWDGGWHYWNPAKRHPLPAYVPDVPAGASGPVQLTEWKIKALRVCAVLEVRGYVTRADFKHYGMDHRRWTGPGGWLVAHEQPGAWKWKDGATGFGPAHPVVYPQILEEVRAALQK